MFWNKKIRFVTHDNRFHTDDVFSTATLLLALKKEIKDVKIIRTRDKDIIDSADYVYDTGGVYDESKNRFDHHQEEFNERSDNGILYSSFGLIWKKFGEQICGSKEIADNLEKRVIRPIDAIDNGVSFYKKNNFDISPYIINDIISAFDPSWPEKQDFDSLFLKAVEMAKLILEREIIRAKYLEKEKFVLKNIYNKTEDKRIIVLEENYSWEVILNKYPEPLFVIEKRKFNFWSVKTIRDDMYSFDNRAYFPQSWAGKNEKELADITGVNDAVFCHKDRFICAAKSKEGAVKLAKLALENFNK